MVFRLRFCLVLSGLIFLTGCASSLPRLKTVERLDIERYMGPWYVIAAIPTFIETKSYNAVEEYQLLKDGTINTIFTFRQGGFDGPLKRYNPRGFIRDKINKSSWGMRFVWPFKAEFLITHVDPEYTETIISRNRRDFVWIMARAPKISEDDYARLVGILKEQGYDISRLRRVPQEER